ncbi:MAG: biopolymer transporter ExbD [Bacteroidaceae bacterium]|nr:biopolymer transporter ExbD [Bacteroidaceae bacterium]
MIKRRTKTIGDFSMSSMTDIIFLLLIFFMLTSTIVIPNAIKVNLPQGKERAHTQPMARITIKADLTYYAQWGKEAVREIQEDDLTAFLAECSAKDSEMFVALYADETVPYREVVKVLNIANENKYKMVLATRRPDSK